MTQTASTHCTCFLLLLAGIAALAFSFPLQTARRATSASFGEYRPGHLHAGIDFATFGQTGLPVCAVAAGRVYRLRSSPTGYGNAVYIRHDDGRRSVYAHLEAFAPRLEKLFPRRPHPLGGDFAGEAMEVYPPAGGVRVEEKEVIGRSGEAGAGLPHFHFEFRDSDDRPVNPVRAGVLDPDDVVPPTLVAVILEPATETSVLNGSAAPVILDSTVRNPVVQATGAVRVLVKGFDEDGRLGGLLGLTSVRLFVDGRLWSDLSMDSFTYGRDKEAGCIYDLFRTGFGPTSYTVDITGPDGAGEVLRSRGPVRMDAPAIRMRVEIADLAGNRSTVSWRLTRYAPTRAAAQPEIQGGAGSRGDTTAAEPLAAEFITRGGIVVRRGGKDRRIRNLGAGSEGALRWRVTQVARDHVVTVLDGARLTEPPAGLRVFAFADGTLPSHPASAGPPILLGPYGMMLDAKTELILDNPGGAANGIAMWRNGSWNWIGGSVAPGTVSASLPFLAPVMPVRDTAPPAVAEDTTNAIYPLSIRDDFSGVDESTVAVWDVTDGRSAPVAGRYDADRDAFRPDEPVARGRRIRVRASDRAGNVAVAELVTAGAR